MSDDTSPQPGPRRARRIAQADARRQAVARDRIALFRAHGYPPHEIARLASVALEEVVAMNPAEGPP